LKKEIKRMLRENKFSFEDIKGNLFLEEFYLKNIPIFEEYWQENLKKLKLIKRNLESNINSFDLDLFRKVGNFFSKNSPEKIKIWICMGNETVFGSGNAFSPNLAVVFPRKFRCFDEKSLKNDFAVLIHEIVHLCQNMCSEVIDKEFLEKVTSCFAPRGVLINEEKRKVKDEFYLKLKDFFTEGRTISELIEHTKT